MAEETSDEGREVALRMGRKAVNEQVSRALDDAVSHPAFRQYPHATQDRIVAARRRLVRHMTEEV